MIKINWSGTLTQADIERLCKRYDEREVIIVIPNTKEQSSEELKQISMKYPNIKFSVIGGLNPIKMKFNNEHYQRRTYYTALELSKIISVYRSIEKQIDLGWTETQKAMYIYQELCNRMEYSENSVNGRDYSRGIGGLLYGKAVCSGFAMIYKEALDRIGIECYYQNKEGCHSWNIAKLDGKYRALELTWDTSSKSKRGCDFKYFNREGEDFYSEEYHDVSQEPEENKFLITPYTDKELNANYRIINQKRVIDIALRASNFSLGQAIRFNGMDCVISKRRDGSIILKSAEKDKTVVSKAFTRKDGTHFLLTPLNGNSSGLNKFAIISETKTGVKFGRIFSEEDLISLPAQYDTTMANGLLSDDRVTRKINEFNGYVGYVGSNHGIYYSAEVERANLNIMR